MTGHDGRRPAQGHATITRRILGGRYVAAGAPPLIAVANPALLPTWTDQPTEAMKVFTAHPGAWLFTTCFLAAGFAVSVPAVVILAGLLDSASAKVAAATHLMGTALLTITPVFSVTVTQDLFGKPLPDWYLPLVPWTGGVDTTVLGLLWPVAQICFGIALLRTPLLPRWTGWTLIAVGILMLTQLAVLGGVIPAPMFFANIAIGVAATISARR
ncbi:hypothetical protein ACIA5D_50655 [Actinoplanes sp. NPDC051513]|uniref:hypothetical protein n=1 Tax=Actinoplanes sp. NPDC051513 TaxID=3363908 RepID=UPI0037A17F4B